MIFFFVAVIFSPIDFLRFEIVELVEVTDVSNGLMSESSEVIDEIDAFLSKTADLRFALKIERGRLGVDWTIESSVKLTVRLIVFFIEPIIFCLFVFGCYSSFVLIFQYSKASYKLLSELESATLSVTR